MCAHMGVGKTMLRFKSEEFTRDPHCYLNLNAGARSVAISGHFPYESTCTESSYAPWLRAAARGAQSIRQATTRHNGGFQLATWLQESSQGYLEVHGTYHNCFHNCSYNSLLRPLVELVRLAICHLQVEL